MSKISMKQMMKIHFDKWQEFTEKDGRSGIDTKAMQEVNNGFGKQIKGFQMEIESAKLQKRKPEMEI